MSSRIGDLRSRSHHAESRGLSDVAGLVTADLVETPRRSLPTIRRAYDDSPYASEVSFEEYSMGWYHLFYTAVIDRLISNREIVVPRFGIATYVVTDEPAAK